MAPIERPARFLPYPELVEPAAPSGDAAPFRIRDSREGDGRLTGAVDLVARRMLVPLDAWSRATMRHELGHVRWSPRQPARVRFDRRVLASVEDARVNLALAASGVPVALGAEGELYVAWLLAADRQRGDALAFWLRAIAAIGTSVEPTLRALLESEHDDGCTGARVAQRMRCIREALEDARRASGGEVAPERRARALARQLARALRGEGVLDARGQAQHSAYVIDCCAAHADETEGSPDVRRGRADVEDEAEDVQPGRLRITRAALSHGRRASGGLRGWRAAREGAVVRYAARWYVDRAIFRRRARSARGTLLVDVSGSMRLRPGDLDATLAATRAGLVVAIYSGTGEEGELRVVAAGSLRAADAQLAPPGNGNVVDLPALAWLARQPEPRVWVSDGHVTGIGDRPSKRLREECEALARRARIRRVAKLDEARALLGS